MDKTTVAVVVAVVMSAVGIAGDYFLKRASARPAPLATWPFLAGLVLGWLAVRAWRRPSALVPSGVGAWLGAAGLGMVLRVTAGQGTAVAFVLVALAFLGLFLLGWRVVARIFMRGPEPR